MTDRLMGLLLDFDGTIADTERHGHRVAYNLAFAELGLDWHWDEALYGRLLEVAGGKERLRHYLATERPAQPPADEREALLRAVHAAKIRHFTKIAPTVKLRPGIERLVTAAHAAGIKVAVATTSAEAGVAALIGRSPSFAACFDLIAGAETAERKKPAPDIYLRAMERLGLDAKSCVAIEDSSVGLAAARAAGLVTLVTISDYTEGQDFAGAAAVLTDLGAPGRPARAVAGPAPASGLADLAYLTALLA